MLIWNTTITHCQSVRNIDGYIFNERHEPYFGANIVSPTEATVSDTNGYFLLDCTSDGIMKVAISALGYQRDTFTLAIDSITHPLEFILKPVSRELDAIEVNGNRVLKFKKAESISVQLVEEEFLKEEKAGSLMQTISKLPGISSASAGTGLSQPVIRGLGYYRVVVARNGLRTEGQQWNSHHGIAIDQESVQHVEVIKGPASLQYGSGAIGGVINILPDHIPLSSGLTGELRLNAKSNTHWLGGSGQFSFRTGDWYMNAALSYQKYQDLSIPATDSFYLPTVVQKTEASHQVPLGDRLFNTAGKEAGISFTTGIIKPWGNSYFEGNYLSIESGFFDWQESRNDSTRKKHLVSHSDIQLPWQSITDYSIYHFTNYYIGRNKLELALGYQQNNSKEYAYLLDISGNRKADKAHYDQLGSLELALKLHTANARISYTNKSIYKHQFNGGISLLGQQHVTDGYGHILPEYQILSAGLWLIDKYAISKKISIHSGVRYDVYSFSMDESLNPDPEISDSIFNRDFQKNYGGLSASLGTVYSLNDQWLCKINIAKGHRVPSAYELGAYGLHRHDGRFEKGDTNNTPEKVWQFDFTIEANGKTAGFSLSPFANYFSSYLFLHPTAEIRPEGQVYEYRQTKAMTSGVEANLYYRPAFPIEAEANFEYVYSVNLSEKIALPSTPPLGTSVQIHYLFPLGDNFSNSKLSIEWEMKAAQEYTVINELSTPGYNLFHISAKTNYRAGKQAINFIFRIQNILNTKHFNHLSFYRRMYIPEPGRDIQLFIEVPF